MEFSTAPIVSVQNASIYQDDIEVLKNINFDIYKGAFLYLIGRTGSGKSSLLKTLYADLPLKEGAISVCGFDIKKIKKSKVPFLRRKLGIIFQDFQLFYDRTVTENLLFVMKATGWKNKVKMQNRISDVLMQVGLGTAGNKFPHQLSGGEQQRIVVARALINEPHLIVADEPTGNLDPEVADGIMDIFKAINKSGTAVLMATHNYAFIEKYPSRVLKIEDYGIKDSSKEFFTLRGHDK